jgi:hypothetical protein
MTSSNSEMPFTSLNVSEEEKLANQAICPNGHIVPASSLICPVCQRSLKDLELPETKVALEPLAPSEGRPFVGWLVVLEGSLQGEDFHLHEGRNMIGSSPPCEIRLQDEGIEDRHASIRFSSNQWTLTDLDSEHGTFLNGKRIYRHELKDGDKIVIGKSLLRVKTL